MSLPTGTITFLFSDVAGSTPLWERQPHAMGLALQRHDEIIRRIVEANGGEVFKTVGDAFHVAFATPAPALVAAIEAQAALEIEDWGELGGIAVRMAIHTGTAELRGGDYFGPTVNRVARVLALAHPGQVLISNAAADLVQGALPEQTTLRSLGEFELRGMVRPERIYQVVSPKLKSEFPEVRPPAKTPTNLPPQLSSFVGRETEMGEVLSALRRSRLATLTGAGGSGKTRLAIEAASECAASFPDGVFIAELAPISDERSVVRTVAEALDVLEEPGRPMLDTLADELRPKKLLLILDNCEHVLDASADLAESLLRAAPNLHILATSREAIGIQGEAVMRIKSLSVPEMAQEVTVEDLSRFDATELFLERARAADQSFQPTPANCSSILQICRRLDGIPLALELAASRIRGMTVGQLAERLDDRFLVLTGGSRTAVSRQRTLRALIDWSYDLLSEQERQLLPMLSVFSGGWTLEAAEAVGAADGIRKTQVLDLLSHLVEKSLLYVEPLEDGSARYRMLETIRQYAQDKLMDGQEFENVRTRHMRFFQAMILKLGETTRTTDWTDSGRVQFVEQIRRLAVDWENVRSAVEWAIAKEPAQALVLASTLTFVYGREGKIVEGLDLLERAISAGEPLGHTSEYLEALNDAASLAFRCDDYVKAERYAAKAIEVAKELGDRKRYGTAILHFGNLRLHSDYAAAKASYREALEIGRELDDPELIARGTYLLMLVARDLQDMPTFGALLEESDAAFKRAGMVLWSWWTLSYRGSFQEESGNLAEAARIYLQVLKIFDDHSTGIGGIWQWECIARVASRVGLFEEATVLYGAAAAHRHRLRWPVQRTEVPRNEAALNAAKDALGERFEASFAQGRLLSHAEASAKAEEAANLIQTRV